MTDLVQFPLEDGGSIVVEVDTASPRRSSTRGPGRDEVVAKAEESFESALDRLRPAADAIISKLRGLTDPPDDVEVEFGLKLSAEAGAIVAAAGTEANFKIRLSWKRT